MSMAAVKLVLFLLAALAILLAGLLWLLARLLMWPPRMVEGRAFALLGRTSPADLGLPFEPIEFVVRDKRTGERLWLSAWWIPQSGETGRCAVLLHGYADSKIGVLAWAPVFRELGYHILALDLRGHGHSEGRFACGVYEPADVSQVLAEFRASRPLSTRSMVLFGASFGGAIAAAAAHDVADVGAVILDSPPASLDEALRQQMRMQGLPPWLARPAQWLIGWQLGADLSQVDLRRTAAALSCPILLIQPTLDPLAELTASQHLRGLVVEKSRGQVYRPEGAGHLMGSVADPQGYLLALQAFLESDTASEQGS
jgi:pimeloyl-ACP methyl ester carboxylesterase